MRHDDSWSHSLVVSFCEDSHAYINQMIAHMLETRPGDALDDHKPLGSRGISNSSTVEHGDVRLRAKTEHRSVSSTSSSTLGEASNALLKS